MHASPIIKIHLIFQHAPVECALCCFPHPPSVFLLQQLMRERQQMASRPFASVAVSLDARGELAEVLQPVVDVSLVYTHTHLKQCIIIMS